ncbi:hypothetical protein Q1695_015222 [Nippostrongylus brasiliensis]|nr:hypothetical protein Q1695_015222 [Nippostrongylus brasiliensis]
MPGQMKRVYQDRLIAFHEILDKGILLFRQSPFEIVLLGKGEPELSPLSNNRERVEEERWTRGRPVLNTRHAPVSFERVPVQRIVEDYRRSDYRYDTDP